MSSQEIQVKDLPDTASITTDNEIMILTDSSNNVVQNITVSNFNSNNISADNDNVLIKGSDNKLYVENPENITGELDNLTTSIKTNLVDAVNELDGDIGDLSNLQTSATSNLVAAVNSALSDLNSTIGDLTDLDSSVTTSIVNSINSVISDENSKIGSLGNLDTTDKSSLVNAINEVYNISDPTSRIDYIRSSRGFLEEGEYYNNSDIYKDVYNYAHSTFDLSKFTVVGSPNITSDGVISNGTISNYIKVPNSVFSQIGTKKWKIVWKGTLQKWGVATVQTFGLNINSNISFLTVGRFNNTGNFFFRIVVNDNGVPVDFMTHMPLIYDNEPAYEGYVEYNGTKYTLGIKIDGQDNYTTADIENSNPIMPQNNDLQIGYNLQSGSVDLKQFSITVDGVPVFSGNKTGTDTFISDNYTVVGSPTVIDGVASNFSSGNYVSSGTSYSQNLGSADNWEIEMFVTLASTLTNYQYFIFGGTKQANISNNCTGFGLGTTSAGEIRIFLGSSSSVYDIVSAAQTTTTFSAGSYLGIKFKFTGTQYILYTKKTDEDWVETWSINSSVKIYSSNLPLLFGGNFIDDTIRYWNGSIDLNTVKVKENGKIVYVASLEIPYTESSTGSKVVDKAYLDRVLTVYELNGKALYYTLDEENKQAALPLGEVYGFITQNAEEIETKAELDLSNISSAGKETALGWGMPDIANRVLVNSGVLTTEISYTAPSKGYIAPNFINFHSAYLKINDVAIYNDTFGSSNVHSKTIIGFIPVEKNDVIKAYSDYNNSTAYGDQEIYFYPMKGV